MRSLPPLPLLCMVSTSLLVVTFPYFPRHTLDVTVLYLFYSILESFFFLRSHYAKPVVPTECIPAVSVAPLYSGSTGGQKRYDPVVAAATQPFDDF